jgi:hypothetical protein
MAAMARPAHADPPTPKASAAPPASPETRLSNEGRADQLFHSGEKKFDGGDYAGACADFAESLKLGPKLGTLLNLALCHETVGKFYTAWSEFAHGAAWAAQNNQRDRHEFATAHIRSIEPKLSRIVLQLPGDRAFSTMELDGEPVPEERWYLPLYLDPGEHHLAATAPGKRRTTIAFRVTSSPTDQLVLVPPLQEEEPPVACKPPPPKVDLTRRWVGIGSLGLGAIGAGLGLTFGVLAISEGDRGTMKTDATIATASFVTGAVLATVGAWLFFNSTTPAHTPAAP